MKYIYVITYFIIQSYMTPCPDAKYGNIVACAVYHGETIDTVKVERITFDTITLNDILKEHPTAKVDTFLISKK